MGLTDEKIKNSFPLEKKFSMRVAAKILQSISTGIYRTPANAIKELINNGYDADASRVDVKFFYDENNIISSLSIRDTGRGIHPNDFEFSMQHIGSSLKRMTGNYTPSGRPIIGKIGIGLLAVGQASHKFVFRSSSKNYDGVMRAEIDLSSYYDAIKQIESLDELEIGNVQIFKEEKTSDESFTEIILENIDDLFMKDLMEESSIKKKNFDFNVDPSYKNFVLWMDKMQLKREEELSGFNRFVLELGLLTPVRYLPDGPIKGYNNSGVVKEIKNRLEKFNFQVFVNNIEIFKPIAYPLESDGLEKKDVDYKVYELNLKENLSNDQKLVVKGYFYHQVKRLLPWTFRGMLIRVNNAGIGTYENRFSKIPIETPILLQQFTGELYVDEGLDNALNIDRNSFFESDESYKILLKHYNRWIKEIAQDIVRRNNARQKQDKKEKQKLKDNELKLQIKNMANQLELNFKNLSLDVKLDPHNPPNVNINKNEDVLKIAVSLPRPKKSIDYSLIPILVAVEMAQKKSKDKQDFNQIFKQLLEKLEI